MNQQAFEAGKSAYKQGNLAEALAQLSSAKGPGEVSGTIDHLRGNCLMRLGRYAEAAQAYADALGDASYGHAGALACNRGRALLAANRPQEAVASLTLATQDEQYSTPYKAYVALGNAYKRLGNVREAGVAYRSAAIDEANPDPSSSLRELGGCFMQMGRAVDAVEAYRTALDFSTPLASQSAIYGDLGLAYVAANRMAEAVDAFGHATADGSHTLSPEANAAFEAAKRAVAAIAGSGPSETDAFLAAAGYGSAGYDPLDPTGSTGEFMPSPEDTGFFSVSEEDLVQQERKERKVRRKRRHPFLRFLLALLVVALILCAGGGYAYWRGYGWPTQESVVKELFSTGVTGGDVASYLSGSVSDEARAQIKAVLPGSVSSLSIDGVDQSMAASKVLATATLPAGGQQSYTVELVRDGIGWKVSGVSASYASQQGTAATTSASSDAAATAAGSAGEPATSSDAAGTSTGSIATD